MDVRIGASENNPGRFLIFARLRGGFLKFPFVNKKRGGYGLKNRLLALHITLIALFAVALAVTPGFTGQPHNDQVVIMTVKELHEAGLPLPGGSFIPNGEALSSDDLVMFNRHIAVAISVGTPNPWGYPASSILDAAPLTGVVGSSDNLLDAVRDGRLRVEKDTIWDMEFLMDNWDSWSPGNSKPDSIMVSRNLDFDGDGTKDGLKGVIASRKFAHAGKTAMDVVTNYVLGNDDNYLRVNTIVTNPAGGSAYAGKEDKGLLTGYSLGNKGAYMFVADPEVGAPYNKYSSTYGKTYNVSLIDLGAEKNDIWGSQGYKDTEHKTVYTPGNSYSFEATLRVDNEGSLEGTLEHLMDLTNAEKVTFTGKVIDAETSQPIVRPIIVVEKNGKTFTWVIGREDGSFGFNLPKAGLEDYRAYALKEKYTPSSMTTLSVSGNGWTVDTMELKAVDQVAVSVNDSKGKAIDARVEILDVTVPAVRYVAQTVFYTDLLNVGRVDIPVASGDYRLEVSSGGYFTSLPKIVEGKTTTENNQNVIIGKMYNPAAENWYNADLHHHSNKSDGSTLPIDLVKSQLANGMDLLLSSDHDSIANNGEIAQYAQSRNVGYIPSMEISPSWGHFNVFPITATAYKNMTTDNFSVDPFMDFPAMVEKVEKGGNVLVANHPYIAYGLFTAQEASAIPGGYSADFNLIEINGAVKPAANQKALEKAMEFWTAKTTGDNASYYLTGGSDTHDVLLPDLRKSKESSGKCRTYAAVSGPLTSEAYLDALLKGHSYVSMGPLLFADGILGETKTISAKDEFKLSFEAASVLGLSKVEVFTEGNKIVASRIFDTPSTRRESFSFTFTPPSSTWYNIIVTDIDEKQAISNPVWIQVQN
jgi:hypothetical protein